MLAWEVSPASPRFSMRGGKDLSRVQTGKIQRSAATFKKTVVFGSNPQVSILRPPKPTSPFGRLVNSKETSSERGCKGCQT